MPIEDVFFIKGKGVVVAGRIEQGFVHNHQIVEVVRDGRVIHAVKVGRIESFRTELQTAQQGDDVGILLPGLDQSQVLRGDMLRR
jgi:elongation factor Tu